MRCGSPGTPGTPHLRISYWLFNPAAASAAGVEQTPGGGNRICDHARLIIAHAARRLQHAAHHRFGGMIISRFAVGAVADLRATTKKAPFQHCRAAPGAINLSPDYGSIPIASGLRRSDRHHRHQNRISASFEAVGVDQHDRAAILRRHPPRLCCRRCRYHRTGHCRRHYRLTHVYRSPALNRQMTISCTARSAAASAVA